MCFTVPSTCQYKCIKVEVADQYYLCHAQAALQSRKRLISFIGDGSFQETAQASISRDLPIYNSFYSVVCLLQL